MTHACIRDTMQERNCSFGISENIQINDKTVLHTTLLQHGSNSCLYSNLFRCHKPSEDRQDAHIQGTSKQQAVY